LYIHEAFPATSGTSGVKIWHPPRTDMEKGSEEGRGRENEWGVESQYTVVRKETGHLWPYYTYMAVFIRNAANLAHILPKTSRTTFTSEVFL
jgi:hypothetical protein